MRVKTSIKIDDRVLKRVEKNVLKALRRGVEDCIDDLIQTSSGAAPHWKGVLEGSHSHEITAKNSSVEGTVEYAVFENGFNYALYMHEGTYNLGPNSLAKPGGQSRLSGKHYDVGPKFLERPLQGDKEAYRDHIEKLLKKEFKG